MYILVYTVCGNRNANCPLSTYNTDLFHSLAQHVKCKNKMEALIVKVEISNKQEDK